MNKANLFIVGAAKAGTTSLSHLLSLHADINFSPIKEPNFFSTDIDILKFSEAYKKRTQFIGENYFNKVPLQPLQLSFVRKSEQYAQLFKATREYKYYAEASTSYLFSNLAAKNIWEYNPEAKILIILRNPYERTLSHYNMALKYGFVNKSFAESLKQDIDKKNKAWGQSELFIELSSYFYQVERYFNIFPKKQVKIILFEDLVEKQEDTLNSIYDFLGITKIAIPHNIHKNKGEIPRFPTINKLLYDFGANKFINSYKIFPNAKKKLKTILLKKTKSKEIPVNVIQILRPYFLEEIQNTAKLINRDLSHWHIK